MVHDWAKEVGPTHLNSPPSEQLWITQEGAQEAEAGAPTSRILPNKKAHKPDWDTLYWTMGNGQTDDELPFSHCF